MTKEFVQSRIIASRKIVELSKSERGKYQHKRIEIADFLRQIFVYSRRVQRETAIAEEILRYGRLRRWPITT